MLESLSLFTNGQLLGLRLFLKAHDFAVLCIEQFALILHTDFVSVFSSSKNPWRLQLILGNGY